MKILYILALMVLLTKTQCVACGISEDSHDDLNQTRFFVNFLFRQPIEFQSKKMSELNVEGKRSYYFKYDTQDQFTSERFSLFVPISLGAAFQKSFESKSTQRALKDDLCTNWLLLVQAVDYKGDENFIAAFKNKASGNMVFIYKR